jgi:hypothetical protein
MSRGPGRVHRAILEAISTTEALQAVGENCDTGTGPVGVPVEAIQRKLYLVPAYALTRSQRESFNRAVRILTARGQVDTYSRRWCILRDVYSPDHPCAACGQDWGHPPIATVGRPRTEDERKLATAKAQALMARARAG